MKKGFLKDLLRSKKTVFSFGYLRLLWDSKASTEALKSRINYYVKRGDLYHIRRGLYAKDQKYDRLEVATKIIGLLTLALSQFLFGQALYFNIILKFLWPLTFREVLFVMDKPIPSKLLRNRFC